jgi:spermidine/putrescine transport system substrate-binding protein
MVLDPRARRPYRSHISRRDFLARSAATAAAFSGTSAVLAACGGDGARSPTGADGSGIQIASPENPARLPIADDNQPIESGLEPEAGPLKIYNWDEYIWPKVVKEFAAEYKVDYEISTFYNMEEAVSKIRTGQIDFDLFFPEIDVVPKLVAAKLIQPLNHSYIPNLKKNVWPQLADPFYDRSSRYTVPYVVYTTGIAWRTDLVDEDIAARENPYDVFWDSTYKGRIGIYDSYREAMAMVLLKNGIADVNTDDPDHIELVEKDLRRMQEATNIRTTISGAYEKLPQGEFAVHQSWSGDIVAAPYYFPQKDYGDPRGLLRYWWPENGKGDVNNDTIAILSGGKNPVLAHHFLNFMLETKYAVKNFSWVGYQPPMNDLDPDGLVKDGYVVPNLKPAIVREHDLETGFRELALPPEVDALWQDAWSAFKSGA